MAGGSVERVVDPKRWQRICEVFEAARNLHGAARDAVVASVPDVADEVRELLAQHETRGGILGDETTDFEIDERVGAYRIQCVLGRGGMATVYLADGPDGPVALKRLHPILFREPDFRERFRREAALGTRIQHPNVIRTLGVEGEDCLLMEFVEGQTLREIVEARGPLPEGLCRHIGREIALGLEAIHASGAIHRDLKPANVILMADERLKVMDLGIALSMNDLMRLSRTGDFVGTARYSAPEQLVPAKAEVDGRTDLYALGLLLYELAAGHHPIPGGGLVTTMRAQLETMPERLRERNGNVSAFFEALVHALIAKRPEGRLESAALVASILEAGEEGDWWQEHPDRTG